MVKRGDFIAVQALFAVLNGLEAHVDAALAVGVAARDENERDVLVCEVFVAPIADGKWLLLHIL